MEQEIVKGLVQAGALGAICFLLIFNLGKKMDKLHDALLTIVKESVCRYRERE